MAKVYRIRTKLSARQVVNSLLKSINRISPRYMAREILEENMKDFMAKSQRGSDRTGTRWKPLAPSTVRRKINAQIRQKKKSVRQKRLYSKTIASDVKRLKKLGYKHNAALALATSAARLKASEGRGVPINIETDKMRKSIRPGTLSGDKYYPPANQKVSQTRSFLRVSTKIPYAKYTFDPSSRNPRPIMMPAKQQARWGRRGLAMSLEPAIRNSVRGKSFVLSSRV